MGDTARYFHSSLYSFTATARTAVLTCFNAAIGHGSVKCWYDTKLDVSGTTRRSPASTLTYPSQTFVLECPTALGIAATADEKLGAIIERYIRQDLEAAEDEEVSWAHGIDTSRGVTDPPCSGLPTSNASRRPCSST